MPLGKHHYRKKSITKKVSIDKCWLVLLYWFLKNLLLTSAKWNFVAWSVNGRWTHDLENWRHETTIEPRAIFSSNFSPIRPVLPTAAAAAVDLEAALLRSPSARAAAGVHRQELALRGGPRTPDLGSSDEPGRDRDRCGRNRKNFGHPQTSWAELFRTRRTHLSRQINFSFNLNNKL